MSRKKCWSSMILALMLTAVFSMNTYSIEGDDVYREGSTAQKMFHKLGRGVVNVLTGWIEIPKNMAKQWKNIDPFSGVIVGGAEGFAWAVGRTATGLYDVVTFFLPIPTDYQPLMEPEFILPGIWGDPIPEMEPVSSLEPLH